MFPGEKRRRNGARPDALRNGRQTSESPLGDFLAAPWLTLAVAAVTAVGVAMVVDGGDRPFPYQVGQRADRDILLRNTLELPNEARTRQHREENASSAPIVFRNDPKLIDELKRDLLRQLRPIAGKAAAAKDGGPRPMAGIPESIAKAPNLEEKLQAALADVRELGVLDLSSLPHNSKHAVDVIEVRGPQSEEGRLVRIDEVAFERLESESGPLAASFTRQFGKDAKPIFALAQKRLQPTLVQDYDQTRENRDRRWYETAEEFDTFPKGSLVVEQSGLITEDALRLLREEHRLQRASYGWRQHPERLAGTCVVVFGIFAATWYYLSIHRPKLAADPRQMVGLCGAAAAVVVLARLLRTPPYYAEALPVVSAALLLAVIYDRLYATVLAVALSVFVALMSPEPMQLFVVLIGGSVSGALTLDAVRSRTKLIKVGAFCALGLGLATLAMGALADQPWPLVFRDAAWRGVVGIVAGFLVSGGLPFIEQLFGVATAISLKELADNSHPLLRELIRKAPGTHNHSWTVSVLGEAAAKSIDADAEVVRVGALFHDIGKMNKAQYFIENKSPDERNRHEMLAPAMSTLIIIGHVKDGVDLARQHNLPKPIIDLIEQHHGTTRVDYFYNEATKIMQQSRHCDEDVEEAAFRYPGPRPQSKEAAVLMLTDCVESASRTLIEPTPARIEKLVRQLAMNRLLDGQFDESGLTLQELKQVEDALIKSLASVYHGRVRYPAAAAV